MVFAFQTFHKNLQFQNRQTNESHSYSYPCKVLSFENCCNSCECYVAEVDMPIRLEDYGIK